MGEYFVEQGLTYAECLNKIRMKYGERVTILYHKNVRIGGGPFGFFAKDGVEITGMTASNVIKAGPFQGGPVVPVPQASALAKEPLDFKQARDKILELANNTTKSEKAVESPKENVALNAVLKEIQTLKKEIAENSVVSQNEKHVSISRIEEVLKLNDFSGTYTQNILDRIKKEFSLEALNDYNKIQDAVLEWIGTSINLYKEEKIHKLPRIMVLVGPTGVGKTTTIAKLAAIYGITSGGKKLSVRMITIDAFRIGAKDQIKTYSEIMQIPVSFVEDNDDLKKTISQHAEGTDLFLVDTIGKSPRDSVKLAEMKQLLDACGTNAEPHLAVAATTKLSDLKEIIKQFEPFN
jgi:flagellar biosynthesis protein FlhF